MNRKTTTKTIIALLAAALAWMYIRNASVPTDSIYPGSDLRVLGQEKKMGFENHGTLYIKNRR